MPGDDVYSIFEDREGNLWFGCYGITHFDGVKWTSCNSHIQGLEPWYVADICETHSGDLWFAMSGRVGGAVKFDGAGWTIYTTADGLAGRSVRSILEDNSGNWSVRRPHNRCR
jgi:hypothetical protein